MGPRIFAADTTATSWTEYTHGEAEVVRFGAPDLKRAQRERTNIREEDSVDAVLDVKVSVAADFRTACRAMAAAGPADDAALRYVGTLDGLAGLVSDIHAAGVADGVTLIPVIADQDAGWLAGEVLRRLDARAQARAS